MTQALEQRIYTPNEYLELELASETRSEGSHQTEM
jgi:hypothetical protein